MWMKTLREENFFGPIRKGQTYLLEDQPGATKKVDRYSRWTANQEVVPPGTPAIESSCLSADSTTLRAYSRSWMPRTKPAKVTGRGQPTLA